MGSEDDWIEAELERELLATGSVQESESDQDVELDVRPDNAGRFEMPEAFRGVALPDSFRELMHCMEDWGNTMEEDVAEAVDSTKRVVEDVEQKLQAAPVLPNLLDDSGMAEEDRRTLKGILSNLLEQKTLETEDPAAISAQGEEAVPEGETFAVPEETKSHEHAREPEEVQLQIKTDCLTHVQQLEPEQQEQERKTVLELLQAEEVERAREEEQRRIEEYRMQQVQLLEREQQEALLLMQREMQRRQEEEQRYREMMAMHSEEIHCLEFYEAERAFERRERRALAIEDRCACRVREEVKRIQESSERRQEASVRAAMAREDRLSAAMRRAEWEQREAVLMGLEDATSWIFSKEMLRVEETQRLTSADHESWRWRELQREQAEALHMAVQDRISTAMRNAERRQLEACEAERLLKEDILSLRYSREMRRLEEIKYLAAADAEAWMWREQQFEAAESSRMATEDDHATMMQFYSLQQPGACSVSSSLAPCASKRALGEVNRCLGGHHHCLENSREDEQQAGNSSSSSARPGSASRTTRRQGCRSGLCLELQACVQHWKDREPPVCSRPDMLPDFGPERAQKLQWTPALRSVQQAAADNLAGVELGVDSAFPTDIVRLELRQEDLHDIPDLSFAPNLRSLALSGNNLGGQDVLRPLQNCKCIEELQLCQNSLTSLQGLEALTCLTVLRATMNKIVDTSPLTDNLALRELELSKNRLSQVQLRAPNLAKLVLYRNALTSTRFLEYLPSLTELDLGRNQLTELDPAISEWNPLLVKVYLYENHLTTLPRLRLPLLTDLWLDNNKLESLGPLGFLPSLERLRAKDMKVRTLASPLAASPLLHTLELAFNQLAAAEPLHALPLHPRLQRLQLNDNPLVEELLDRYRPWVLRLAPNLLELDNEGITEAERRDWSQSSCIATTLCAAHPCRGLLSLAELTAGDPGVSGKPQATQEGPCKVRPGVQDRSLLAHWRQTYWNCCGQVAAQCGCDTVKLAAWCEMLTSARSAQSIPYHKQEKRRKTLVGSGVMFREQVLLVLRLRRQFWTSFLDLCRKQYESLSPWCPKPEELDDERAVFEPLGEERRQLCLRRVQARCRGVLSRKLCARMRLDLRCKELTQQQRQALTSMQAMWRGWKARKCLRAQGVKLPKERRHEQCRHAATQLQAAFRGSSVRRKLRWAREMARVVDDGFASLAEVDMADIIGGFGDVDPFAALKLPEIDPVAEVPAPKRSSRRQTSHSVSAEELAGPGAPVTAWSTPPPTAGQAADGQGNTPRSQQSTARESLRRSRSLSSTAESAVTEAEGALRGLNRVEQAKEEWGFQDSATAKAYLAAQRHRQRRPPAMPSQGRGGACRNGGRGRAAGQQRQATSRSQEPAKRAVKAQDAIAAWRLQDEDEPCLMQFQTGEPNLKLMRSSKGLAL